MSRTAGGRVDGGPATPVVQAPPPEPGARWTPRPFVNGRARTGTGCPPVGASRPTSSRRTRLPGGNPSPSEFLTDAELVDDSPSTCEHGPVDGLRGSVPVIFAQWPTRDMPCSLYRFPYT